VADAAAQKRTKRLWATVNICDTKRSPDTIGIRASMPGNGRKKDRMYMRFRVQYFSTQDNLWHNFVAEGTDSGFRKVGSGRARARQSGWSFPFDVADGQRYELRGHVNFEWRRGRKVVRRDAVRTRAGHATTVGDPKGYSAASCVIKG
jgi:hypothetical protein